MGSQKGAQMEAKMVPKSIRSSPRAPLGLLWEALGLYFWHCFFNTIFELRNVMKIKQKWTIKSGRPNVSTLPTSPSRTLPLLQLPLKGTPNPPSASGRRFPEPVVTRGTGKRRRVLEWMVDNRVMIGNVIRICKH